MKLILKQAKIIDPSWNKEKKRFDIAIKNGKIEKIASNLDLPNYKIISSKDLHVSIGFFDIGTQVGEPGLEHREDLNSITAAAAAGGYTGIAAFPNNYPTTQSKSEIKYILNNTSDGPVTFYPIGAVSKSCKGEDITEFMDMKKNGAIAFSDGKKSINDAGLMLRALQYAKGCDAIILNHPDEHGLSGAGQVHEGKISVSLGLEGIPDIAESLGLQRDVQLAKYSESKYCAYNISSAQSVKILKKTDWAKATVSYMNLIFTENDVETFDSNLKVFPPLRGTKDRNALIKAIKLDHIDAITSGHQPLEEELKKKSFAFADFGAIGIETAFAAIITHLSDKLSLEKIIEKISIGPRQILEIDIPQIKEGELANLCIFDPKHTWVYEHVKSKSKNSPFFGATLQGKVLGTINNGKYISQ